MKKLIAVHIVFLMSFSNVFGQVQDSAATGVYKLAPLTISPGDTVDRTIPLSDVEEEEKIPLDVIPWIESAPVGSSVITNDSLLRWELWPNWGDYQAYRRDVISFRQGTAGRVDAFHINGFQPYEQQVELEGIHLNNPITGLVNYNLVPQRKIGEAREEFNGSYRSEINLRDYYITRPLSYLNYDESDNAYRNLEFMVARNFTDQTNLELSYWDRRDGDFYPNNNVTGSQMVARLYHHLDERLLVRAFYLRNQFDMEEPFGYDVPNPQTFPFDQFTSSPVSSNGNSEFRRWDLITGIYHRKDTASVEDAGFEAMISKNKNDLRFSQDTLSWDLSSVGAKIFKNLYVYNFDIQAEIEAKQHSANNTSVINYNSWNTWKANLDVGYTFGDFLYLFGKGNVNRRSDDKQGYEVGGGFKLKFSDRLNLSTNAFRFDRIPTMQELYWQSNTYRGNLALNNEKGISVTGTVDLALFGGISVGASGRIKNAENTTFLGADSSFFDSGMYNQISATLYGRFENSLFEVESSVTAQAFEYEETFSEDADLNLTPSLNEQDEIIWMRNSAFVKGYVFNRAAYLKFGIKTLLSPQFYSGRTYNTELNFWQGNSTYHPIPPFLRVDAELSARVRAIMVVMRWENVLDDFGQAGYFEAAGFPMPPRRLIVGIRAQFRN